MKKLLTIVNLLSILIISLLIVNCSQEGVADPFDSNNQNLSAGEIHNDILHEFFSISENNSDLTEKEIDSYLIMASSKVLDVTHFEMENLIQEVHNNFTIAKQLINSRENELDGLFALYDSMYCESNITIDERNLMQNTSLYVWQLFSEIAETNPEGFCTEVELYINDIRNNNSISEISNNYLDLLIYSSNFWILEFDDNGRDWDMNTVMTIIMDASWSWAPPPVWAAYSIICHMYW